MRYVASLHQRPDGTIDLTVFRGQSRYRENLTPEQATELAHQLMSFVASQQPQPFYLLGVKP